MGNSFTHISGCYQTIVRHIPAPALPGTIELVAQANPRRWAIIFISMNADQSRVCPMFGTLTNVGIPLPGLQQGMVEFNVRDHGNLPMLDWYSTQQGFNDLTVIEVISVE